MAGGATRLSGGRLIRNRCTTAQRVIAEGGLPVPGGRELAAIQELGAREEGPGKISAVEHGFEQVRPLQTRIHQLRIAQLRPPQIYAPKIRPRKIEAAHVEPSQGRT